MFHQRIRQCFSHSAHPVSSVISEFIYSDIDPIRNRKFSVGKLITSLVSQGFSSTKNESPDFFNMDPRSPTTSALNQQRARLSPDALEAVFRHPNHLASFYDQKKLRCCLLATDGSAFIFFSRPASAPEEYHVSEGHPIKGLYSMHLNVFYDLQKHTYSDMLIQPIHQKDESSAFCEMADRYDLLTGMKDVLIGDRSYYSYNSMTCVREKDQYFLFRTKNIHSKGLVGNFESPDVDSFDIQVNVTLVRSHKKKISVEESYYKRFADAAASFDYVAYGPLDTYDLPFRVIRSPIPDDSYERTVTNLPSGEFPSEQIKLLYYARWAIEGPSRKLKYTVGLSNFRAYKPEYIKQEI